MGTWGSGNLDSDGASDILAEQSKELVDETLVLAGSKLAAEYDEYDYDKLFVNFETLFAMERARLLQYYPDPEQVVELKDLYLAAWDAFMKENGVGWEERRAVIAKTFDRLCWIAAKEKRRIDSLPQLVEVKAPSLSELSDELVLSPHAVFADLHISLPTVWEIQTWSGHSKVPDSTLVRRLVDQKSGEFAVKECRCTLGEVFFATGGSLTPEKVEACDNPYLLIARLRLAPTNAMPDVFELVCDTEEILSPSFQGDEEHVSGVVCIDTLEEFEFDGLESFRRATTPDQRPRFCYKNLYYHKHSATTLLLLETGNIEDVAEFHFPDKVLVEHIVDSMRKEPPANV